MDLGYDSDKVWSNPARGKWPVWRRSGSRLNPSVFIPGAQKGGTTSLYAWLVDHPKVERMVQKETYFFNDNNNYQRGLDWYLNHFEKAGEGQVTVDASANYLESAEAPSRIKTTFPKAKAIILLRNPVDRAFSHYRMNVAHGIEQLSFEEALAKEEERITSGEQRTESAGHNYAYQKLGYRSKGVYVMQLKYWLHAFDKERLLILDSQELFDDPETNYASVLTFLDLPPHQPGAFERRQMGKPGEMNASTREELNAFYKPHNSALEQLLNRKFNWG